MLIDASRSAVSTRRIESRLSPMTRTFAILAPPFLPVSMRPKRYHNVDTSICRTASDIPLVVAVKKSLHRLVTAWLPPLSKIKK